MKINSDKEKLTSLLKQHQSNEKKDKQYIIQYAINKFRVNQSK